MHEFAFGVIGIRPHDYYCMTERDYVAFCNGYKLREARDWERTRILAMFSYNSMSTKPISDPKKLFKIPAIDGEEVKLTTQDIKEMFAELTPR